MSIEAMSLVLHHSEATGAAKLILLGVANHQGDSGAWPSVETLSRYARVSERRAQQLLRWLEESGELVVEAQAGGWGQYRTNLYWVAVSCPEGCDGSANHKAGVRSGDPGVRSRVARGEVLGTSGVKPTSPKPLREPREEPKDLAQGNLERARLDQAFEEFWSAYPRKVEKLSAKKTFAKVWSEYGDAILAGVHRMAQDPYLPPKQYIPHPATWLNAGGWDSEPYPERERTPEEKTAIDKAISDRKRAAALEETRLRREESERVAEQIRLNPPKRCEHDRVAVMCPVCSNRKDQPAQ